MAQVPEKIQKMLQVLTAAGEVDELLQQEMTSRANLPPIGETSTSPEACSIWIAHLRLVEKLHTQKAIEARLSTEAMELRLAELLAETPDPQEN